MDEFKEFVVKYPKLRDDVRSGTRTWQNIYEEWVIYGESDRQWDKYRSTNDSSSSQGPISRNGNNVNVNMDGIKNVVSYIQKINPDSINRTLNTVQKVIQIAQGFGGKSKSTPYINSPYDDWWD
jgi:hypothetical protein